MRKPDTDKPAIALWVARNRDRLGLSAEQLAERSGYSRSAISKVEGGSNPKPSPGLIGAVFKVLREVASERGDVVVDPPGYGQERGGDAIAEAIDRQTAMLERMLTEFTRALQQRPSTPDPAELERLSAETRERGWPHLEDDPDHQPVGRS